MLGFTGAADLEEGCRALRGARRGLRGRHAAAPRARWWWTRTSAVAVPAFQVDVVDTTGCGDAFSAGFLRGLALGRDRAEAARMGCATAALVAQGLGTDHGQLHARRRAGDVRGAAMT